jgi:hypothetical protein
MRWSYSRYGTWKKCPRLYKYRVIDNLPEPPMTEGPAVRGTEIHAMFEAYLKDQITELTDEFSYYQNFLDGLKAYGVHSEIKLAFDENWEPVDWDAENMWFRCILDALVVQPDRGTIYDWKTGREYKDHADQREIYSISVLSAYPELYEASAYHTYIDTKQNTFTTFHRDQLPELKAKWKENVRLMFEDTLWPANPSFMCRYCNFSRYKGGPCAF